MLDHWVTEVGDVFDPKEKVEKRKRDDADDVTDQLAGDPVAAGISAARIAAAASAASPGRRGVPLTDTTHAAGEAGVEAELFADLEADVLDDFHLEMFGEPPPLEDLGASLSDDDAPAGMGDAAEECLAEASDAPEEDGAAGPGVSLEADPLAEAVAHCKINDEDGAVTCSVAPWNAFTALGYFTSWPKTQKDRSLRNISCHCAMHLNCRSPAKGARTTRHEAFFGGYSAATGHPRLIRSGREGFGGLGFTRHSLLASLPHILLHHHPGRFHGRILKTFLHRGLGGEAKVGCLAQARVIRFGFDAGRFAQAFG